MNQAIHQVDMLRWLGGPVKQLFAFWQWAQCTESNPKMW